MKIDRFIKNFMAGMAIAAASLLGAGLASARQSQGPALWKVADADTTIYLFGTIHTLPQKTEWQTTAVSTAIAQSDTLVLELVAGDPAETAKLVGSLGTSPNLPPLAERIPPEKRGALERLVKASGYPVAFLNQLESWAAAIALVNVSFGGSGFSPDLGVETQLTNIYKAANKPIIGLETATEQLGFLDGLPEDAQRALLVGSVDDPAAATSQLRDMLAAWLRGDVAAIARTFDKETRESPELRESLILKRNAAWTQWIADRMAKPGTVFIAVGAGHLAGGDSVQRMLADRGLKAKRIN